MFYAIIDSASLKNPTLLNNFQHQKVTVSFEPESTTNKYHYNFLLELKTDEIEKVISNFQKVMLPCWYSFFWSKSNLYIVFNLKYFKIDLPNGWSSNEYIKAQEFGKTQSIPEIYLDFKKYFKPLRFI